MDEEACTHSETMKLDGYCVYSGNQYEFCKLCGEWVCCTDEQAYAAREQQ